MDRYVPVHRVLNHATEVAGVSLTGNAGFMS